MNLKDVKDLPISQSVRKFNRKNYDTDNNNNN